jgi:hypothetical protein
MSLPNPAVFIDDDGVDHRDGATPKLNSIYMPVAADFSIAQGAANVCNVTITIQDNNDTTLARPHNFEVWLSDAATGIGLTATTASGTVQAKAASGTVMGVMTTKKALRVQSLATGVFILEITDTAKTGFYVAVKLDTGAVFEVSRQLVTGDYG